MEKPGWQPSQRARRGWLLAPLALLQLAAALAAALSGCASPGDPVERKPPTPLAVSDLAAEQVGNTVVLTLTVPKETVDRSPLDTPPAVEIYRAIHAVGASGSSGTQAAAPSLLVTIPSAMVSTYTAAGHLRYIDSLTAGDFFANQQQIVASYVIRTLASPKKESADSNHADLNIYPATQPVADLQAEVAQAAIALTWTAPSATLTGTTPQIAGYRVYRANAPNPTPPSGNASNVTDTTAPAAAANPPSPPQLVEIGESAAPGYQDATAQRDKTYTYSVRSTMQTPGKLLESADSNLATVTLHDLFPPSTPTQLIVTPVPTEEGTAGHMDLSWAINPETDITGYNVYRSEQAGVAGARLNSQPLPTPAFRDMNAVPGRSYFYTVTAVDRTGNESAASAAAQGVLPAESQASP